jgi:transcriptional regulator with XRE-family HTH domain
VSNARARRLQQALDRRGRRKRYALAIEIGVNPSSMTRWLQGEPISIEHAMRLCEVLEISLDWLLLGRGHPDPTSPDPTSLGRLELSEERLLAVCRRIRPEAVDRLIDLLEALGYAEKSKVDTP